MTKKARNIIIAVIGVIALAAIISVIINMRDEEVPQNIAGTAEKSAVTVKINDIETPAYDFHGAVYIVAENLQLFGLGVSYDGETQTLNISSGNGASMSSQDAAASTLDLGASFDVYFPDYTTYIDSGETLAYSAGNCTIIPVNALSACGSVNFDGQALYTCSLGGYTSVPDSEGAPPDGTEAADPAQGGMIIVLDPGHGKGSGSMSEEEKEQSGWVYSDNNGGWGEWRHFKYGTLGPDCEGDGCSHRVTPNGACWYPIGNGDRDTEPAINLSNCLAAKSYLEQMGYTVRLTRSSNEENPSITRRLTYCYPNNDTSQPPDAAMFVCIHSNAGGGSGSSYISLAGEYDQPTTLGSSEAYVEAGNALGQSINEKIGEMTLLGTNGPIDIEPELIAFCKAPVICGYMEIGFFDNPSDLEILTSSSDAIGHAIASGIDSFVHGYMGQ